MDEYVDSLMLDLFVASPRLFKLHNFTVHLADTTGPQLLIVMVPGVLLNHPPDGLEPGLVQASPNDPFVMIKASDIRALKQLGFFEEMNHSVLGKVGNR